MMATLRKMVTTNLRPPHTIIRRETKNMNSLRTLYSGINLIPMMLIIKLWAWGPKAKPHSSLISTVIRKLRCFCKVSSPCSLAELKHSKFFQLLLCIYALSESHVNHPQTLNMHLNLQQDFSQLWVTAVPFATNLYFGGATTLGLSRQNHGTDQVLVT
jgi:hypothetical protein